MHFSKTYAQLLLGLPPELQENAIEYRQLKKLINKVVVELSSLGLSPEILHELLEEEHQKQAESTESGFAKVVYEFNASSKEIQPQLRVWGGLAPPLAKYTELEDSEDFEEEEGEEGSGGGETKVIMLKRRKKSFNQETVIPLVSDTAFYQLLSSALESLTEHLQRTQSQFIETLKTLSTQIASSSHPTSASSSHFRPYSKLSTDARTISVPRSHSKSDLDAWRAIFQMYVEAEIFESIAESDRGERSVEESERRLTLFTEKVSSSGVSVRLPQSRQALDTFLDLNTFILNVKKFQQANSEATRKILKKHAKRTALPLPSDMQNTSALVLAAKPLSLPHIFVQAVGETLLPIIPHIDDYGCLICTSLAFKPIRLSCGHLFCVRCLVKMQKRGQGDCPMCRAPTVLTANRSNVDWALLNFMQDWFPTEAREKLQANEKEATEEEMRELGFEGKCAIM